MFNVLQGVEFSEGRHMMPTSRIYSGDFPRPSQVQEFEDRAKLPTVVMEEGAPLGGNLAYFVQLGDFAVSAREVSFELLPTAPYLAFPASILDEKKYKHSLSDGWNWHHTCWQYGTGNLFETLYKYGNLSQQMNEPNVFKVRKPPMINQSLAACMMPFASQFDDVYSSIKVACENVGLNSLRVDEIYGNTSIIADVVDTIDRARVVICDLTGKNPNVLYEMGISHTLGREVIIIAQDIAEDVPFDLRHMRCVQYDGTNQTGRDALMVTLERTIRSVCKI